LGGHLAEVVLDGASADEELGADLRVRLSVGGESSDLGFLRGEDVACVLGPSARRFSGGKQLATGALGEGLGPEVTEHLVCSAKLTTRVHTASLAPEPFAVEQMRTGELDADPRALESLDRLPVARVSVLSLADQCS